MRKVLLKSLACVALAFLASGLTACNGARPTAWKMVGQNGEKGFTVRTLARGDHTRKYGVFVPLNYDASKRYPMIVFLHGIGEAGSDAKAPLHVGLAPFVADRASDFPFICLFPQSTGDWNENSAAADDVIAAIEEVSRIYSVDRDRVSLTGLSTGGYGTWAIGAKYPQYFAALVPMCCSSPYTGNAQTLAKMNIWAFENAADMFVMPGSMAASIGSVRSAGGTVKHTVYPAPGHDCWDTAYSKGELFEWLLQQRRSGTTAAPAAPAAGKTSSAAPAHSPAVPTGVQTTY